MALPGSAGNLVTGLGSRVDRPRAALAMVLAASIGIILVAYGFEHIGKYRPCPLCLIERYAYYFAILVGIVGLASARLDDSTWLRVVLAAIAIGYLVNMGLGVHHAGVEWKWWAGPDTCSAPLPKLGAGLNLDAPVIRCDAAPWHFLGLSFAGWNAVLSLTLACFAGWAAVTSRRPDV